MCSEWYYLQIYILILGLWFCKVHNINVYGVVKSYGQQRLATKTW